MSGNTTWFGVQYPSSSDYVKDGATAIQTVADGFDSAVAIPTYNAQIGTTYTFVLADTSKTVTASNAAASIYTIPPQSSVVWVANTTINVTNLGAGTVTFAGGVGVTVTNTAQTLSQYQSAQLIRTGSNAWTVVPASGTSASLGLTLIKTQTIGSAVSSVNVTGAFSATYDAYKIIITGGLGSIGANIALKLGSTTTGYYAGYSDISYATGAVTGNGNNNAASFTLSGYNSTSAISYNADLQNPFLAKNTILNVLVGPPATGAGARFGAGFLNDTTSYTDFTLTPSSGTLTGGTIRVYGYNN